MHNVLRQLFKRQCISQRLAATLQCEWNMNVTNRKALTVDRAHRNTPVVRVDACQLRNVAGDFTIGVALALPVNFLNVLCKTEEIRNDKLMTECTCDENDVRLDDT